MSWLPLPQRLILRVLVFLAAAIPLAAGPAAASDYCVTCQGPQTTYRCVTNDGREGAGKDQREALHCITEIARRQGHGSCSIDNTAANTCLGQPISVDVGSLSPLAKPDPPAVVDGEPSVAATPAPGAPGQDLGELPPGPGEPDEPVVAAPNEDTAPGADDPAGQPTLLEKSQQNIEKAGNAIGTAAKKSWDCMSSLFKDC